MKSVAQAITDQSNVATADPGQVRLGGTVRTPSPLSPAIADQGKIRLGGAWRLPANRKAG